MESGSKIVSAIVSHLSLPVSLLLVLHRIHCQAAGSSIDKMFLVLYRLRCNVLEKELKRAI